MTENNISRKIFRIDQELRRLLKPGFLEIGLTLGQGQPRILNALFQQDMVSQKELAQACSMEVPTLSRVLDKLEENGWVQRLPNPKSRRSVLVTLTEEGRRAAERVHENFRMADRKIRENMDEEKYEMLYTILCEVEEKLANEKE